MAALKAKINGCKSKNRYPTRKLAETVGWVENEKRGVKLRVYHCEFCYGFHMTKKGMNQNHATTLQPRAQLVTFNDKGHVTRRQQWRVE